MFSLKYFSNLNIHRADLKSLINKLQNELKASTAQNCFISSEIFSELSSEKLYLVLENLSELFKSTSIFLTTRNIEMAALSGLKHRLRKNSENPKLYKDVIKRPNLVFKRICRSSKEKISGSSRGPSYLGGLKVGKVSGE